MDNFKYIDKNLLFLLAYIIANNDELLQILRNTTFKTLIYSLFDLLDSENTSSNDNTENTIPAPDANETKYYTATDLGEIFGISAQAINRILHEIGFIAPQRNKTNDKFWVATELGAEYVQQIKNSKFKKIPFMIKKIPVLSYKPTIVKIIQEYLETD